MIVDFVLEVELVLGLLITLDLGGLPFVYGLGLLLHGIIFLYDTLKYCFICAFAFEPVIFTNQTFHLFDVFVNEVILHKFQ